MLILLFSFIQLFINCLSSANVPDAQYAKDLMDKMKESPTVILDVSMKDNADAHQHIPQLLLHLAKHNQIHEFKEILYSPNLISWDYDSENLLDYKMDVVDLLDVAKVLLKPSFELTDHEFFNQYDKRLLDALADFILPALKALGPFHHQVFQLTSLSSLILNYYMFHGNTDHIAYFKSYYFSSGPAKLYLTIPIVMRALKNGNFKAVKDVSVLDQNLECLAYYSFVLGDWEKIQFVMSLHIEFNHNVMFMILLVHNHRDIIRKLMDPTVIQIDSIITERINMIIRMNYKSELIHGYVFDLSVDEVNSFIFSATSYKDHIAIKFILFFTSHFTSARRTAISGSSFMGDLDIIKFYFSKELIEPFLKQGVLIYMHLDAKHVIEIATVSLHIHILEYMDTRNWITSDLEASALQSALSNGHLEVIQFFMNRNKRQKKAKDILEMYLLTDGVRAYSYTIITYLIDEMNRDGIPPQELITDEIQDKFVEIISGNLHSVHYFTRNYYTKHLITSMNLMEILDHSMRNDQLDVANYILSRPDLKELLPVDQLFKEKQYYLVKSNNLESLERIYNGDIYDAGLSKKLLTVLETKNGLEDILSIKHSPTSFDIFCFQQIPQVALEFVKKNQFELFDLIMTRKHLVDWKAADLMKPINYQKHILRPIDILDIAKVVFRSPTLDSLVSFDSLENSISHLQVYNNVKDEIKASLSNLMMNNMHSLNLDKQLLELWVNYLSFYGKSTDLERIFTFLNSLTTPTRIFSKETSLLYILQHKDIKCLSVMIQYNALSSDDYHFALLFSCFKGLDDAVKMLLSYTHDGIEKKDSYELEMALIVFHKHDHLKELFISNQLLDINEMNQSKEYEWIIQLISNRPIYLSYLFQIFDYEFLEFIIPKVKYVIQERDMIEISKTVGAKGDSKSLLIMYDYLPNFISQQVVIDPIIYQASYNGHSNLLKNVKQLSMKRPILFSCIVPALVNRNNDIIDVYQSILPYDFTPNFILNTMMYMKVCPLSYILLGRFLDQVGVNFEESLSFISLKTVVDVQSLQYAAHNYYLSKSIDREFLIHLLNVCIKDENHVLLLYILSEWNLFVKLSMSDWHSFEHTMHVKRLSKLKKVFKKHGTTMYRMHSFMLLVK